MYAIPVRRVSRGRVNEVTHAGIGWQHVLERLSACSPGYGHHDEWQAIHLDDPEAVGDEALLGPYQRKVLLAVDRALGILRHAKPLRHQVLRSAGLGCLAGLGFAAAGKRH